MSEGLADLMNGLATANKRMDAGSVSAVIHAAADQYETRSVPQMLELNLAGTELIHGGRISG